jgi:hypothetical protein
VLNDPCAPIPDLRALAPERGGSALCRYSARRIEIRGDPTFQNGGLCGLRRERGEPKHHNISTQLLGCTACLSATGRFLS